MLQNKAFDVALDVIRTGWQAGFLALESQAVVTYRVLGMTGVLRNPPRENQRMLNEKGTAFAASALAASMASAQGDTPDKVMRAAIRPLRRKTHLNARRLGRAANK